MQKFIHLGISVGIVISTWALIWASTQFILTSISTLANAIR